MRNLELGRIAGLLALVAAVSMTAGCNKMLANFSLNQAKKREAEAQKHKAGEFAPELLNETNQLITQTTNAINSQDFATARQSGKDAATKAKELVEETKLRRANFLKEEANRWVGIGDVNEAEKENPDAYKAYKALNEEGIVAHAKPDYDKAIEAFDKVVADVQFILQNLKERSESGLADVKKLKEDLIAVEAPAFNPEGITQIDENIARITDLIEEKREYRVAIAAGEQAIQDGEKAKVKTKEIKSERLIAKIEERLQDATKFGAAIYALDTWTRVSGEYENLLRQHYEGKYDTVLNENSGPDLLVRAEALIVETQRESARSKLANVKTAISKLVDQDIRNYLPGRIEEMEEVHEQARVLFEESKYLETEELTVQALEREKTIKAEFDRLAEGKKTEGRAALDVATGVFERMQQIFARELSVELGTEEQAFQDGKEAMREELRRRLDAGREQIAVADERRGAELYSSAITIAEEVGREAGRIVDGIYKVVTFDSIQELTNLVSVYEREGGREYAAANLSEAEDFLSETRDLYSRGEYRPALEKAAATHARLEDTLQELERVAIGKIEDVRSEIAKARDSRADYFQEGKLAQVQSMLREASDQLGAQQLKRSIGMADNAIETARDAGQESIRLWAEEELRQVGLLLARAEEAGSPSYSPEEYDDARSLERGAEALYAAGDFAEARTTAAEAVRLADRALYAPVIKAEDEIAAAKRYGGWRYEWERLSEAMINAGYAREFMDQGKYSLARQHAAAALDVAGKVAVDSKRAAFYERLEALDAKLDKASTSGAGYYQIGEMAKIVGDLNQVATDFAPEGYEEAEEKIELLEAQLAGLVEMTPRVVEDLARKVNERLAALDQRGARVVAPDLMAEAEAKLHYAQLDFKNGRNMPSFQNARDAVRLVDRVALALDERDYDLALGTQFTEFSRALEKFSPVLNAGSPVLMQLVKGPTGRSNAVSLMNAVNPGDLRQEIGDVIGRVRMLTPPSTRAEVHEKAIESLEEARQAASDFEKLLIMDQYSLEDARDIVDGAYLRMRSAREGQRQVQQALATPQTVTEQVGVRRAIESR